PNAELIALPLMLRYYERVGDFAVSLVRRVGFLVPGESADTLDEGVDAQEFRDAVPARVGPPRRSAGRPSCAREHERAGQPRLGRGLRVTSRSVPVCAPRLAATRSPCRMTPETVAHSIIFQIGRSSSGSLVAAASAFGRPAFVRCLPR